MSGNRAVNNTNPMAAQIKAQQAAYLAAGGVLQVIPLGQGSGSLVVSLSAAESRKAIKTDMGKFFNA